MSARVNEDAELLGCAEHPNGVSRNLETKSTECGAFVKTFSLQMRPIRRRTDGLTATALFCSLDISKGQFIFLLQLRGHEEENIANVVVHIH